MKKLLFVLASEIFRDAEYIVTRAILEQQGFIVSTLSRSNISVGRFGYTVQNNFIVSDMPDVDEFDGIVFIGGAGSLQYIDDEDVKKLTLGFLRAGKLIAAICAAPRVLLNYGVLVGKSVVGNDWDNNFEEMCHIAGASYAGREKGVEVDGNIISAYGPEEAELFANTIVEYFK